jgi:hypothetical protein
LFLTSSGWWIFAAEHCGYHERVSILPHMRYTTFVRD